MTTDQLYLYDSYQKTATAKVVKIETLKNQTVVYLDQTIFYAQGGGQPADQGKIVGKNGQLQVTHVSYNGGELQHKGSLTGTLNLGETVALEIDWPKRYQHMQWHTAGHILDQAVKNVMPGIHGVNGEHGIGKKLYVEFDTEVSPASQSQIQAQINNIIAAKLAINTEMVTKAEIIARQIYAPFDLPTNKQLRIVQIGEHPAMPDGGTQLANTEEAWPIKATEITKADSKSRIYYEVSNPEAKTPVIDQKVKPIQTSQLSIEHLKKQIQHIQAEFKSESVSQPELHTKYLSKKGLFNELAKILKELSPDDRRQAGQLLNELKTYLETEIAGRQETATTSSIDLTLPGIQPRLGHLHPVSQAVEEITRIFQSIGFTRVRYPEVEWDWYAFGALNMPTSHPARDEWETFFVDAPPSKTKGKMVLTPHTSNGQVREMERLTHQPPMRMINITRTYRRQQDATHTQMFHQFEGLVVDKGITIQHLKGTLDYFAEQFYGPGTKSRIRPFHFQFTEPSFEVDFSCHICHGKGYLRKTGENLDQAVWGENIDKEQVTKCKFCKSGWHEVGGAGMVHPNVLKAGGIDPNEYTGFAFGWGVERTYSLKEGLQVDDIRLFYSNDVRFLQQF